MASLASEVSGTQMVEFFGRFGRFGGSRAKLQRLLGDDEVMEAWVKRLDEFPEFRLVHGVFNTTVDVLAAFKARCAAKGIDFGKFSWVGSEQAPEFDPNDPETVVVLDATLDTLQNTFEFAWAWTGDGQDDKWRYDGMLSDAKKLRLLSDDRKDDAEGDGPEFKPYTLRWVRIKLDTNVGKKPIDVRNPKSTGCALLFMSAEHPARIKATDYEKRFGFWLPGLKCTAPDGDRWRRVPCVDFRRATRQVKLGSGWSAGSHDNLAVPSFRE
ncbi:hypothetical protein A3E39_02680 [Candidatus Uhrbacteria bacterium RIFCSPHIGHO2_12_FULL_60_25]|uniref:Uncharacterized protein n=1 Tax=Candidatus Uhrbacteria bacterium RIFCSPHIGHO2_12_FULL_60_25 TaxID=1802399 RepID=A0A1F7UJC6_9BACT|nr:MAG: hypothetical protein A3D73_03710 [Candidatus Uhrbacteria bacterium RIFCSPHIGHO2_02_FULL_60_44]OGL78383.1 MAG: hypothetical protein A3E39_02680 [Candidatus Uhrbacteria bacterium RIFCSPHIGHO2_12_FULL_60_25]